MLILIDNYDSFTYNLVHYFEELGQKVVVYRNDKISAAEVVKQKPAQIVISPGPCDPDKAGITLDLIKLAAENKIPLIGICLGHQAIGQAFGGKVIRADLPYHGKTSEIFHEGKTVFKDLESPFLATRYHSLIIEKSSLPDDLEITATTKDGMIMGVSHKTLQIHGVQFHPESIASENGHKILQNFINLSK